MVKASRRAWDVYWRDFREQPIGEFGRLTLNEYRRVVSQLLDINAIKLVVEAGSGGGTTSVPFMEAKAEGVLIDISREALVVARKLFLVFGLRDKAHLVVGDALHMPIKDGCVDLVFNQGVLEHFNSDESVEILKEMKRVGRNVMVLVPYRMNVGHRLAKFICRVLKRPWPFGETIERDYTEEVLVREMQKASLKPAFIKKWGRTWALKHLLVIITSNPAIAMGSKKSPNVERTAYMLARVLSVLTFSFEQLIAVCIKNPRENSVNDKFHNLRLKKVLCKI
ncbi:MAG: class I SAM-dependent methyltransferase [Candidatus Bathyarchaeaceae archaeon]